MNIPRYDMPRRDISHHDLPDYDTMVAATADAAAAWSDPDYPARLDAAEQTLQLQNRFTAEALIFAINQQMSLLSQEALHAWTRDAAGGSYQPIRVGVVCPGNVPLAGLQDLLAVVLTRHLFVGSLSSRSDVLLPAFVKEINDRLSESGCALPVSFMAFDRLLGSVDALIASGTDETTRQISASATAAGVAGERMLIRAHRFSVAVLDGTESADDLLGLAEDMLLHEGLGCRNIAVVFAPESLAPDALLDAMAVFRGTFPAHPDTIGALQMPKAFLEAVNLPHAYGEGLEFLLSRGDPEPQGPGHCRWTTYTDVEEADRWINANAASIQVVSASPGINLNLPDALERVSPGGAQRPGLDWTPDGRSTIAFLSEQVTNPQPSQ